MSNLQNIEQRFRNDLQALLEKYGAEIEARDHCEGYPECGEDVRMTVCLPPLWNDKECIRTEVYIDLGSYLRPSR
jgi:hypothetical protein